MSGYDSEQIRRLEPGYLDNYGLQEAPFAAVNEDRFLYLDAERAQRLNLLQHMTQYSNLLLIVQGEEGVGKTSLLNRFVKNAHANWRICQVTANTMMDAEQLLFQAAQGFGVQQLPQDAGQLQEMLYARVATIHHNDEIPILIIDDAHELPRDALLAIFNLADAQIDDANLLRIILFCEPQIEKILAARDVRPLRDRVTHTMEIPPLDEDTTAEYLKHRLAVAGFTGGSPFTPKMIRRIYKASQGIPARINTLAHDTLENGDFEKEEMEELVHPVRHAPRANKSLVYITGAILLIAVVLVFQDRINRLFEEAPQEVAENVPQPLPEVSVPEEQTRDEGAVQEKIIPLQAVPDTAPEAVPQSHSEAETTPPAALAEQTVDVPVQSGTAQEDALPMAENVEPQPVKPELKLHATEPNPVPASSQQQTITIKGEGFTPQSEVVVSWADQQRKVPKERVKFVSDTQLDMAITVGMQPEDWQVRVAEPQTGQSAALAFRVEDMQATARAAQNSWVMAQEPSAFTLQLFATHEAENAEHFMRQHKLAEQGHYFVSQREGRDWFSVVYGAYADKQVAANASKTLPASLAKIKPWVRRFDDIQASVNASRTLAQSAARQAKPASTTVTGSAPANNSETAHEAWLWSQDPRNFTLQLLGARSADSIKEFLRKYDKLDGTAVFFHTRHDARDWYAVVYGVYSSREQAQAAIARLPAELREASPWIRSFASIHAEMDRADKNQ